MTFDVDPTVPAAVRNAKPQTNSSRDKTPLPSTKTGHLTIIINTTGPMSNPHTVATVEPTNTPNTPNTRTIRDSANTELPGTAPARPTRHDIPRQALRPFFASHNVNELHVPDLSGTDHHHALVDLLDQRPHLDCVVLQGMTFRPSNILDLRLAQLVLVLASPGD